MPQFSSKRRVRHAASDMFDLVVDVEKYPLFVPLCSAMKVKSRTEKAAGVTVVVAAMTVAYKVIHQTFTSRVTLDRANLKIMVEYLDGPFSRLQNRWTFHATGDDSCTVEFYIDYEFKSRTLAMLMGAMFDTAFRKFAAAFEKRADDVYGRKPADKPV
jgi:coenzyme Q-binding protein COQ10